MLSMLREYAVIALSYAKRGLGPAVRVAVRAVESAGRAVLGVTAVLLLGRVARQYA